MQKAADRKHIKSACHVLETVMMQTFRSNLLCEHFVSRLWNNLFDSTSIDALVCNYGQVCRSNKKKGADLPCCHGR
jgi:hypothetical protein